MYQISIVNTKFGSRAFQCVRMDEDLRGDVSGSTETVSDFERFIGETGGLNYFLTGVDHFMARMEAVF